MQATSWALWAFVLFFQNFSFTFVSRARSSGSIARHLKASIFSNGIWIFSNMVMLGPMFDYLTGKHGITAQVAAGLLYTACTVSGSLAAHFWALRTEKGLSAVGASKKYAQIPIAEWEAIKVQSASAYSLASEAHLCAVSGLPDSGISVRKIDGAVVSTGLPT